MFQRLLVPLDGTPFAEGALPYAEALARRSGATIHLVRASLVRQDPLPDTEEARMVARERAYLVGIAERLGAQQLAASVTVQHADPDEAIVAQARQWGAELIIMATHERGMIGRAAFGSVAAKVLADAPAPVLLVQPDDAPPFAEPHRLLLPLDGSPLAEMALPIARLIAAALDAPLTLVTALTPEEETTEGEATAYLREVAARLADSGLAIQTEVRSGHAPDAIGVAAEGTGGTLIVMATRGHTGLRRLILGSTADAVLRSSALPVVLVRATSDKREGQADK